MVRGVFEKIEEEGGSAPGDSPNPPHGGILRRSGGAAAGQEGKDYGKGGSGEGEAEDGGTEPEGDAAGESGNEEGKAVAEGWPGESKGRKEERDRECGGCGEMESVVVGAEGMEIPEKENGGRKDDEGREAGRCPAAEEQPKGGEREKSEEGKKNAPGDFEGIGGWNADAFKDGCNDAEGPDGKLGPVDGAAAWRVVHVSPADPETGGCAEVAGVGEPGVGVGIDEKAGMAPGDGGGEVGRGGGGTFSEERDGTVEEDGHAGEP